MTHSFPCYHLPAGLSDELSNNLSFQTLTFTSQEQRDDQGPLSGKVLLEVPALTPGQLGTVLQGIKKSRKDYLAHLRTQEIVDLIDEAVWQWLNPHYELRQMAEELLPVITGYDREMIRLFLSRYLRKFRKESLLRMIDEDFPNPLVLDEFRPRKAGGLYRAYGPELTTHVFSGNVPLLPLWSMVAGLLLKSATLGKVSSAEPLFPVLFTQTLSEIEPRLTEALAIVWWKGGDDELEQVAFRQSEAVIAYGSERTTKQISAKIPAGVRFVEHGHKVSFGVITNECLERTKVWEVAHRAAQDVSWFDQQGCLSPHVFYVEQGGNISPRDFARMLAQEMDRFERKMPRASLTAEESQAIIHMRSQAEFQSFTGADTQSKSRTGTDMALQSGTGADQDTSPAQTGVDTELHQSETGTSWTVIYREGKSSSFPVSALNRVVTVVPLERMDELPKKLRDVRHLVQTAGVACSPQKFRPLINILGRCGVNRICFIGDMPQPEPGWHHDGRFHLADLVRWCDVEASVELKMDEFDPDRE